VIQKSGLQQILQSIFQVPRASYFTYNVLFGERCVSTALPRLYVSRRLFPGPHGGIYWISTTYYSTKKASFLKKEPKDL